LPLSFSFLFLFSIFASKIITIPNTLLISVFHVTTLQVAIHDKLVKLDLSYYCHVSYCSRRATVARKLTKTPFSKFYRVFWLLFITWTRQFSKNLNKRKIISMQWTCSGPTNRNFPLNFDHLLNGGTRRHVKKTLHLSSFPP